ncbi:nucleoside hydrolase [Microbacterium excoecariae]|uniref:nucleoside hydrolase n=1 Tax=Microbacterium excoecariae TaxID=2715210 RepID=UPI00140D67CA|nr:nucleoside hydrolase [Microbacterium excoecariae]NHI15735.1 nucleoside hydrolase [Microbacterium excoecariae]
MAATPRRVIINTDAKNEADDQFAIVHALLSPTLDIRGIVPAHFGTRRTTESLAESRAEVDLLLRLMGREGGYVVADGAPRALPDERTPVPSEGSALIIEESRKDEGTLFIPFLGPLTDMASALLEDPDLQDRDVVVVWIGGPPHGDVIPAYAPEFNLSNDIAAANVVMDSRVPVWQIPMSVYTMVSVGHEELRQKVAPLGELGAYLTEQVIEFNASAHDLMMDYRSLGDSPAIGAIMNPRGGTWRRCPAPRFAADGSMSDPLPGRREIPVCESMDVRWLLEDMFAKLRAFSSAA